MPSIKPFIEAYRSVVDADAELATAVNDRQALYRNTVEMGTGRSAAWTGLRGLVSDSLSFPLSYSLILGSAEPHTPAAHLEYHWREVIPRGRS